MSTTETDGGSIHNKDSVLQYSIYQRKKGNSPLAYADGLMVPIGSITLSGPFLLFPTQPMWLLNWASCDVVGAVGT